MIGFESKGSFSNIETFLAKMMHGDIYATLSGYGQQGVDALARATPIDSGFTASSWTYEIVKDAKSWSIIWGNTNVIDGRPIAILLQYNHVSGTGGYVQGRDYINPALQPIFDSISADVWKAVTS